MKSFLKKLLRPFLKGNPQTYKNINIKADENLHEQIASIVVSYVNSGGMLLDFGAGEGALAERLGDLRFSVTAVDVNESEYKAASKFERLDFNDRGQMKKFITENRGRFDAVLGIEVIEHVENHWAYVRDLSEMCKNGGYLVISTPNIGSWYSRMMFLRSGKFHQFEPKDLVYGHINPVYELTMQTICDSLGLKIIDYVPGGNLPRFWISKNPYQFFFNCLGFFFSLFMKGSYRGWCQIYVIKKV